MPHIITRLLDAIDGSDDFDVKLHQRLVRVLKHSHPDSLTLRERFRSIGYLQRAVMFQAAGNHALIPAAIDTSSGRHDHTHLDEAAFPNEMTELMRLSKTLRYSDDFKGWVAGRRQVLIQNLGSDPGFMIRLLDWQGSTPETRLAFLREFAGKIVHAYSGGGFSLTLPDLVIDDVAGNTSANTIFDRNRHIIRFGKSFMENANEFGAMVLAYHETLHVVTACMGIAARGGVMDASHPFYEDACLRQTQEEASAAPWREILCYYHDDFEETLAYENQKLFIEELFAAIEDGESASKDSCAPFVSYVN